MVPGVLPDETRSRSVYHAAVLRRVEDRATGCRRVKWFQQEARLEPCWAPRNAVEEDAEGVVCGRRCAAGGARQAVSGEQQIVCGKVVRKGFVDGWKLDERIFMKMKELMDFYRDKGVLVTGHTGFKGLGFAGF